MTEIKVKSVNKALKAPKSVNRVAKNANSLNKGVSNPTSVNKLIKSPASVNREVSVPSSVNREVGVPSSVNREVGVPSSVNREVSVPSSVNREVGVPSSVNREVGAPTAVNSDLSSQELYSSVSMNRELSFAEKEINLGYSVDVAVNSVQEYLESVEEIFKKMYKKNKKRKYPEFSVKLWFRGVKSVQYDLIPRIARNGQNALYEVMYLSEFKSKTSVHPEKFSVGISPAGNHSYWGWLFLMQYYGVPTRILDWTTDALAALVFAVTGKNSCEEDEDSAIWCLDPVRLNSTFSFCELAPDGYIPNVDEEVFHRFFGPEPKIENKKPCAVIGPVNSARVIAQKGVYTVFPHIKNISPLNEFSNSPDYLYRIPVNKEKCGFIARQLRSFGFTRQSLFPDTYLMAGEISNENIR